MVDHGQFDASGGSSRDPGRAHMAHHPDVPALVGHPDSGSHDQDHRRGSNRVQLLDAEEERAEPPSRGPRPGGPTPFG